MNYSIAFSSSTGNTAAIAEHLRELLPSEKCVYFGELSEDALAAPLIFVGFWTDQDSCDENTGIFLRSLEGKTVVLFGTAGFSSSEEYFSLVLSNAEKNIPVSNTVFPGFVCQGRMLQRVRKYFEDKLAEDPDDQHAKDMIVNFDHALTHPDENDYKKLENWVHQFHL